MKKTELNKYVPYIIGLIISLFLLVMGFGVLSGSFTRAADNDPREVIISDIKENKATISWTTGIETQGMILFGESPTSLGTSSPELIKTKTHSVILNLPSSNTTYYFVIQIGDKKYDNKGVSWTFKTKGGPSEVVISPSPVTTTIPSPATKIVQKLKIPIVTPTKVLPPCNETNCLKVKEKLGKGCDMKDYWACIQRTIPSN